MKPTILGETNQWLILDKPRGMSVHNQKGDDLISFVKTYLGCEDDKAYPINRLDSGTAGLVLFAKTHAAARTLQQAFEKRQVTKIYLARVQCVRQPPEVGASGLWRWPLTNRAEGRRDPKGFWKQRIPCQTTWSVLRREGDIADLELQLLTGRKHQIRRHAAISGWPILGDPRYGKDEETTFEGHNLVAKKLTFADPETQEDVTLISNFDLDG